MSDGLFHRIFDEIKHDYPYLDTEHWVVDIGAAKLADTPEEFDVIVMPNLYGDVLSNVAAQIAGSVGLAGSSNIGTQCAMFEAIHGPAPRRAGQNLANPSGLLHGALLMLVHIGQIDMAEHIHNAWLCTLEDGIHTYDIYNEDVSKQKVGTKEFAEAVVERLGRKPHTLKAAHYAPRPRPVLARASPPLPMKRLVGVDVYIEWLARTPDGLPETLRTDCFRCRFMSGGTTPEQIVALLDRVVALGLEIAMTENLRNYDGQPGFSLAQGQ